MELFFLLGVLMDAHGYSYDLDLDTRLSEETTVLVENYTVSFHGHSRFVFTHS